MGDEVTMATEEGLVDGEGRVDLPGQGVTLPPECEYQAGECQTKEGTFVWDPQPEALYCPLFLARPMLNGTEIDVAEEDKGGHCVALEAERGVIVLPHFPTVQRFSHGATG
jgi:hypothetical protein